MKFAIFAVVVVAMLVFWQSTEAFFCTSTDTVYWNCTMYENLDPGFLSTMPPIRAESIPVGNGTYRLSGHLYAMYHPDIGSYIEYITDENLKSVNELPYTYYNKLMHYANQSKQ